MNFVTVVSMSRCSGRLVIGMSCVRLWLSIGGSRLSLAIGGSSPLWWKWKSVSSVVMLSKMNAGPKNR